MPPYFEILRQLQAGGIRFLIMGTWALKYAYPRKMEGYEVLDCDIVLENTMTNIRNSIRLLRRCQWEVSLWQRPVDETVQAEMLKGKYYLRAIQADLVLDLSYEYLPFTWDALWAERQERASFQLVAYQQILAMKELRGNPKDLATILRFEEKNN